MYIKKLTLKNYRNYKESEFDFNNGINIIVGDNAQGKTNCAEAIFFLCIGYSPKATRDKQLIKYGEDSCSISGVANSRFGNIEVKIDLFKDSNKSITVNGVPIKKIGELMGNINSVFFNPGELKLIQQSPEDRRRFMDIALSQMSKTYFYSLQKYRKILEQRNDLLKNPDREIIYETLPLWDEQLSIYAEIVIKERVEFINQLSPYAKEVHAFISNNLEDLELDCDFSYACVEERVKESLKKALAERIDKDIALGYTGIGPHRDDIKIKLNGEDVRVYGSQGQQRTCALSLKIAELEIFKDKFGEYPLLILDDALSELDKSRRAKLLSKISKVQTIITCTEITEEMKNFEDIKVFNIKGGKNLN